MSQALPALAFPHPISLALRALNPTIKILECDVVHLAKWLHMVLRTLLATGLRLHMVEGASLHLSSLSAS